jgi:hypothetical protein
MLDAWKRASETCKDDIKIAVVGCCEHGNGPLGSIKRGECVSKHIVSVRNLCYVNS